MTLLRRLLLAAPSSYHQHRALPVSLLPLFVVTVFPIAIQASFLSNSHRRHHNSLPKVSHRRFNNDNNNNIIINGNRNGMRFMSEQSSSLSSRSNSDAPPRLLWNRETSMKSNYDASLPLIRSAKILSLSNPSDPANHALHHGILPDGCELLGVLDCDDGTAITDEFSETGKKSPQEWKQWLSQKLSFTTKDTTIDTILKEVNVIFVSHPNARSVLAAVIQLMQTKENNTEATFSSLTWIHSRLAGMDFCISPTLIQWNQQQQQQQQQMSLSNNSSTSSLATGIVTNAKGQFSSTLAEYAMGAMTFFAKDFARLKRNQQKKHWDKYSVLELRGATLGIVGYGDIGQATAKLAKAYGMKVIAMRRHSQPDEHVDIMYGPDHLDTIFTDSDYVVCAAPLTTATHKMIGVRQFAMAKPGLVFINVGRGPVVDETALIAALERSMQDEGPLKGAALDVFEIEPLPLNSKLWELDNVLLSPHNMDKTDTFMHESTEFFVNEQLPRFVRGLQLYNEVDCAAGY